MQQKSDSKRWGVRVAMLLAGGAIAGAIAMLALAPRSGAAAVGSPSLGNTADGIYVTNAGSGTVTVYPAGSNENVAPSSTIAGSNASFDFPSGIALDASGNIYVANGGTSTMNDTVTVYRAGSNGNVAPSATIGGSKTGLDDPKGIVVDARGNIYVANGGASVTVYPGGSNGNVAPSSTIAGSNTTLSFPYGIALDASDNIYVTDVGRAHEGPYTVFVYAAGSNGNVAPSATLGGSNTGLDSPSSVALDASGNIYVANAGDNTVTVYPAGSSGNVTPSAMIGGSDTGLDDPVGIALDASGNIYVANQSIDTVTVYPAGSNANAAPSATIGGPASQLDEPFGIAIGPGPASNQTPTPASSAAPTPTRGPTPTPTPAPTPTPSSAPTPTPALVAAKLTASPTSLTFATRAKGTTSKPQVLTLANAKTKKQNQTITVLGVSASGDFAVPAGACVGPLSPGGKCKLSITFTPTATGIRKGSLTVTSNASKPSLTVALKGTGKK